MTEAFRQSLLVLAGSAACFFLVAVLKRRQLLTLRYTLGWIAIVVLSAVSAAASFLVSPISSAMGLTPTGFIFGVATSVLLAVALQLSVSVSRLQRQIEEMARSIAIHEAETRDHA